MTKFTAEATRNWTNNDWIAAGFPRAPYDNPATIATFTTATPKPADPTSVEGVTQADREAAAELRSGMPMTQKAMRNGELDNHDHVQAFMRHRLASHPTPEGAAMPDEWALIGKLRDEEVDSVTLLCDNPEGPPNNAVECSGFWTGFRDRRFEGETIRAALAAAVAAKEEAKRIGYPDHDAAMPDDAVERVARAMCDAVNGVGDFDANIDQRRSGWERQARIGIAAYLATNAPDAAKREGGA